VTGVGTFNVYDDARRAETYARLEFPGTYYLAYRDLPDIISRHVRGRRALDFGCGTGRSTRFLRQLGFDVAGVDIAADMVRLARDLDPVGDYRLIADGDFRQFDDGALDLVLSVFTFDNIPTAARKIGIFAELGRLLAPEGRIVSVVSDPGIYLHEWASFSTKDFPENRRAGVGDKVKIIITDTEDPRPVEDIVWPEAAYRDVYRRAGLEATDMLKPLATGKEPYAWVSETKIAPWAIYVLKKSPRR
jgi:SAM-dependent methyltransferase